MNETLLTVKDMDVALTLIGLAWLSILVMLAAAAVLEMLRWLRGEKLPFIAMLHHQGLTLTEFKRTVGADEVHRAIRCCRACPDRSDCVASEARCPNRGVMRRAIGLMSGA